MSGNPTPHDSIIRRRRARLDKFVAFIPTPRRLTNFDEAVHGIAVAQEFWELSRILRSSRSTRETIDAAIARVQQSRDENVADIAQYIHDEVQQGRQNGEAQSLSRQNRLLEKPWEFLDEEIEILIIPHMESIRRLLGIAFPPMQGGKWNIDTAPSYSICYESPVEETKQQDAMKDLLRDNGLGFAIGSGYYGKVESFRFNLENPEFSLQKLVGVAANKLFEDEYRRPKTNSNTDEVAIQRIRKRLLETTFAEQAQDRGAAR